jgi:hypothetical protein
LRPRGGREPLLGSRQPFVRIHRQKPPGWHHHNAERLGNVKMLLLCLSWKCSLRMRIPAAPFAQRGPARFRTHLKHKACARHCEDS